MWAWKPQVITQVLDQIGDDELLLYLDAGCHLNKLGLNRLRQYFSILDSSAEGIVAFQSKPPSSEISLKYDGRKLFDQWNYEWIKVIYSIILVSVKISIILIPELLAQDYLDKKMQAL